jgi:hypothetical protein
MTRAWRWVVAGLVLGGLTGCSLLKKPGGDAGDAGEAGEAVGPVEAAAAPLASNEGDVTRYPDEKATVGGALTTEAPAELRTQVGAGGKLVVVLKKGTEVDKLAEHAGHYLVVGEDPKDASRKLLGWASESAFGIVVHHREHDGGVGEGGALAAGDGGAHAAGDGGASPAREGGAPAAATDAGSAPATGSVCVKQSPPGTCPAGFTVSGAVCRVPCKAATDCKGPDPKCNTGLCYNASGCN